MNKKKTYSFNKKYHSLFIHFFFVMKKTHFVLLHAWVFEIKKYHYLDGFNFEKVDNTLNRRIEFQKIFIQILKQP
jgi:hypothetical protein